MKKYECYFELNIPTWARYRAINCNGEIWMFSSKPNLDLDELVWRSIYDYANVHNMLVIYAGRINIDLLPKDFDWTKSLIKLVE